MSLNSLNNNYRYLKIKEILEDFAKRFSDPYQSLKFFKGIDVSERYFDLANGPIGMVIVFNEISKILDSNKHIEIAHSYLSFCNNQIKSDSMLSFYSPWSGYGAFAALTQILPKKYYSKFSAQLDNVIFNKERFEKFIEHKNLQIYNKNLKISDYDLLQGISGFIRYLCIRDDYNKIKWYIEECVLYLMKIMDISNNGIPNCFVPYNNQPNILKKIYPKGHINIGLSHGISGILATFSILYIRNKEFEYLSNKIKEIANLIISFSQKTQFGIVWPKHITLEEYKSGSAAKTVNNESWCYGEIGIARSIFLASRALNDSKMEAMSIECFRNVCDRRIGDWRIKSTTFCHGISGLFYLVFQMYLDTGLKVFLDYSDYLIDIILDSYENKEKYNMFLDEREYPGILDGEGGIILALTSYINDQMERNKWDWLFLIN
ncbi:MAG TPA: lanthionine synthetase C family protein [Bacillus sp. (in: firmicutes)]|nr:lanthionine synthetase C family protein [Bacillus sp. (in: firmicutes)]